MIIARSFARIHETNLKVGSTCPSLLSGMKKVSWDFTEAGNLALMVRRQERL
jgi:aconitase A